MLISDDEARREFWRAHLDRSYALLQAMTAYPVRENSEAFASIPDAASAAKVEMLFSETKVAGTFARIFQIREGLINDLIAIARKMNERGWILKIEEGFRTREMQAELGRSPGVFDRIVAKCLWENHGETPSPELVGRRASCLVANTPCTGTHMCGAAVDISVYHRDDGTEVWRGKSYLEMSEYTPMNNPFIAPVELENRLEITRLMEERGFLHYPGEFWHYNKGDALYHMMAKTGLPGQYGPVDWDPRTNAVTPYADYFGQLTSPELIQRLIDEALARLK